ncbi:MAG: DUF4380 domain-containing protein [Armatimonadia bacterium]
MVARIPYICVVGLALAVLAGCGGGVENAGPKREVPGISDSRSPISQASEEATASEVDYHGWRALRLTNGMVTVVAVPDIGGRIVEYKLGGHPFLWTNPAELGKTYPLPRSEQDRVWHDFGGYKVWPAPADRWKGPPDPLGSELDGGKWTGKVLTATGRNVEVELRSPEDKVTGLQITRTIKLFGASSQVRVSEKITNISRDSQNWAFCQMTQVPGSVDSGQKFSEKSRLYVPLEADSAHKEGYVTLAQGGAGQFKVLPDKLLQVSYRGEAGKIGMTSYAGWLAHVDEEHEFAFVQRFEPSKLGDYPDNSNVIVETSGKQSYVQVGLCAPTRALRPGESVELTTDWYATRVGGPVVSTTEVAAVQTPLELVRADGKLKLKGKLGVFAPGNLALSLQDETGKLIGQPTTIKVSPAEVVKLDQELPSEATAKTVLVELQNDSGTPLGRIAQLNLATTIAAAAK